MTYKKGLYETQQETLIEAWETEVPSNLNQVIGFFSSPLVWAAQKVLPEHLMISALEKAMAAADKFSGKNEILESAKHLGLNISSIEELKIAPLSICDILSENAAVWAKGLAGVEGAITGITGIAGLAADVPGLILLTLQTIKRIGFCYGFDTSREEEKAFVIEVFLAGSANSLEEKKTAINDALNIDYYVSDSNNPEARKKMSGFLSREGLNAAIRNLAKRLIINLSRRKATQVIPVIGGGVGAVLNTFFLSDIANSSKRLFQKRRLRSFSNSNYLPAKVPQPVSGSNSDLNSPSLTTPEKTSPEISQPSASPDPFKEDSDQN
ncbi:MAG: EcsC family protein [Candidatus Riflebacteria bacterium]|nr:EcsC family protein [Candidatus Riflebacteria bacterium]